MTDEAMEERRIARLHQKHMRRMSLKWRKLTAPDPLPPDFRWGRPASMLKGLSTSEAWLAARTNLQGIEQKKRKPRNLMRKHALRSAIWHRNKATFHRSRAMELEGMAS